MKTAKKYRKTTNDYYINNPDAREKLSKTMKDYYAKNPISPEQRKKMTSKPATTETRELLSARSTAYWREKPQTFLRSLEPVNMDGLSICYQAVVITFGAPICLARRSKP
jgi:hypothetical protein